MEKNKIISWVKSHYPETLTLIFILILALALRLYRISEFMTFLGDEGRDVRIVRDLITKGNLVFIGPQTSIGNMYLGPLYYYMMAPALLLSGLNPVGPAIMIAILGVFTIWFTWIVTREWYGPIAAIITSFLFAISPVAIIYSRSSWNPNPMPFFALFSIYGIYQVWQKHKLNWLPWVGVAFAGALQMHYLGLLLGPVLFIFWLLTLLNIKDSKETKKIFTQKTILMVVIFLLMMSPLALFDLKHQGQNFNAFKAFFSDRQTTVNLNPTRSDRFLPVINQTISDLLLGRTTGYELYVSISIIVLTLLTFIKSKAKNNLIILFSWLLIGLLGLGVYKQHVYIHYMGFIYPAVFMLAGISLGYLFKQPKLFKILGSLIFIWLVYLNIANSPTLLEPNRQLQRTEAVVDKIMAESKGQPFNFALIAKQNYDESYRYFLENKKSAMVEDQNEVTDQLFVVCEDGNSCQPEGHSQYQIAIFGIAKVTARWQVDNIQIYKMIHY